MGRTIPKTFALAGLFLMTTKAEEPEIWLTACVYDQARVPDGVLAVAERLAGKVYREAGVEVRWLDCSTHKGPLDSSFLFVRLVSGPAAEALARSGTEFGFAPLARDGRPASHAYVFYGRIEEMAKRHTILRPELLGQVIAHEMGHLLLGTNSHSPRGIMSSYWGPDRLDKVNKKALFFTPGQAGRIQSQIRDRLSPTLLRKVSASVLDAR